VAATGKLSEALEWVERLRRRLSDFHQMTGRADFLFGDAADALEVAEWTDEAASLRADVGRNVLDGRWTFQIVEEFDDCYYDPTRAPERRIRSRVVGGRRHVFEAELKERRRTPQHPAHTSRQRPRNSRRVHQGDDDLGFFRKRRPGCRAAGHRYAERLVGAKKIRSADPHWSQPGSEFNQPSGSAR
jgi:hypothetical protein